MANRVKFSLAKATDAVRNKFQQLRMDHLDSKKMLEQQFKPITTKLGDLISLNQHNKNIKQADLINVKREKIDDSKPDVAEIDRDFDDMGDLSAMREQRRDELLNYSSRKNRKPNNSAHIRMPPNATHQEEREMNHVETPNHDNDVDDDIEIVRPLKRRSDDSSDYNFGNTPKKIRISAPNYPLNKKTGTINRKTGNINKIKNQIEAENAIRVNIPEMKRTRNSMFNVFKVHNNKADASGRRMRKKKPYTRINHDRSCSNTSRNKKHIDHISTMHGDGLPDLAKMEYTKNTCKNMFSYWNDPNELVDRLRLLISSTSAGHTGHNNEIISIIEELRESNIIE